MTDIEAEVDALRAQVAPVVAAAVHYARPYGDAGGCLAWMDKERDERLAIERAAMLVVAQARRDALRSARMTRTDLVWKRVDELQEEAEALIAYLEGQG